jgi:hypothetical protein
MNYSSLRLYYFLQRAGVTTHSCPTLQGLTSVTLPSLALKVLQLLGPAYQGDRGLFDHDVTSRKGNLLHICVQQIAV